MTLRSGDYEIHGDSITIRKEVLERWRDHYHMKGREKSEADGPTWQSWYYWDASKSDFQDGYVTSAKPANRPESATAKAALCTAAEDWSATV